MNDSKKIGFEVIQVEAKALEQLAQSLDAVFSTAVTKITETTGRIIVSGIGKSGHIARKISATFASTGTPSLFLHPAEASHGDLGMITKKDILLILSKSGESPELADVVGFCKRHRITIIAITSNPNSSLGMISHIVLKIPDIPEACPLGLAPSTSTTMALAMGDALAIACHRQRNFNPQDFREYHPGGKLGQKLSRAKDVMCRDAEIPLVKTSATVGDGILEMTRTRLGCVGVVDDEGIYVGILTDGDLRRNFNSSLVDKKIVEVMSTSPFQISEDTLVQDVAALFSRRCKIHLMAWASRKSSFRW
jgi:arabinose-5-phosphate isomerase